MHRGATRRLGANLGCREQHCAGRDADEAEPALLGSRCAVHDGELQREVSRPDRKVSGYRHSILAGIRFTGVILPLATPRRLAMSTRWLAPLPARRETGCMPEERPPELERTDERPHSRTCERPTSHT